MSFQFDELENLGYRSFALGFFEENVQAAFTTDCECCVTPNIYDWIKEKQPNRRFGQNRFFSPRKLCFHAMTLNSRPYAIIAFLMFEENAFRVCC